MFLKQIRPDPWWFACEVLLSGYYDPGFRTYYQRDASSDDMYSETRVFWEQFHSCSCWERTENGGCLYLHGGKNNESDKTCVKSHNAENFHILKWTSIYCSMSAFRESLIYSSRKIFLVSPSHLLWWSTKAGGHNGKVTHCYGDRVDEIKSSEKLCRRMIFLLICQKFISNSPSEQTWTS